ADAADARVDDARHDLLVAEARQRAGQRFRRALHVRLDQHRQFLGRTLADTLHHLLEGAAAARGSGQLDLAVAPGTEIGDFARTRLALDDVELVARLRRAGETQDLAREGRARIFDRLATIVDQATHATP